MELCFYGCGKEAKYKWGANPCCSPHYMQCECNKGKSQFLNINKMSCHCQYCNKNINIGSIVKHEKTCSQNPINIQKIEEQKNKLDKICKKCGKLHNGLYGSGKYCCEQCARSSSTENEKEWFKIQKCEKCGEEYKRAKRCSIKKTFICKKCKNEIIKKLKQNSISQRNIKEKKTVFKIKIPKTLVKPCSCSKCNKPINKTKSGLCRKCFELTPELVKQRTDKVAIILKQQVLNGTHKGWVSRDKVNISYPEKFFMQVLQNNNISYIHELRVDKYFIDFAIEHKMIALEIDGKQHEWKERKEKDQEKDKKLTECGWKVYRIKWKSINKEEGKQYIKSEIENFLTFYNDII